MWDKKVGLRAVHIGVAGFDDGEVTTSSSIDVHFKGNEC